MTKGCLNVQEVKYDRRVKYPFVLNVKPSDKGISILFLRVFWPDIVNKRNSAKINVSYSDGEKTSCYHEDMRRVIYNIR